MYETVWREFKIGRIAYFLGILALAGFYQVEFLKVQNWEINLSYVIIMSAISFPCSIVCAIAIPVFGVVNSLIRVDPTYNIPIAGIILGLAGYYQWFVLLPKVLSKFKQK
jgi:hypothetical protein